jgi:hypothetical protein
MNPKGVYMQHQRNLVWANTQSEKNKNRHYFCTACNKDMWLNLTPLDLL